SSNYNECVVNEFRSRLISKDNAVEEKDKSICCFNCSFVYKGALNGVFVNGVRVSEGVVVELGVGDGVLLACGNKGRVCSDSRSRIGFVVQRIVFHEELVEPGFDGFRFEGPRLVRPLLGGTVNKRVFAFKCDHIAGSYDPVSCIRQCVRTHSTESYFCQNNEKNVFRADINEDDVKSLRKGVPQENVAYLKEQLNDTLVVKDAEGLRTSIVQSANVGVSCEAVVPLEPKTSKLYPEDGFGATFGRSYNDHQPTTCPEAKYLDERNEPIDEAFAQKEGLKKIAPPGKNFYLNRLDSMHQCSSEQENVVSLPGLLHPVDNISRMLIATFTSDIAWFLSYCDIPSHLPITIACHNTERCWSADPEKRTCVPIPDFPNLIVVYPPFPEVIAFGKDRKNKGVGCHHPKLFVLQREVSVRVIITSANLWKAVTNTVWWQDFPCRFFPDFTLFNKFDDGTKSKSASDFAAQLAGFMASLITDVPGQAHWIFELAKNDFTEANAHLIASVPGIHLYKSVPTGSNAFKSKCSQRLLGSGVASVVGLGRRFQRAAGSNGVLLKKLAAYLAQSSDAESGMTEIILRREKSIPQDVNAVNCVQLGCLPRTVAKWVSQLWDVGFFTFHGYVYPQEALAAASGESNTRVPLILHVSQRCTGLWRLEEYISCEGIASIWPEPLELDFVYGASSIGTSVGAQFFAAFSAAAGKKSLQAYDSEESDPEWGCWNASLEMKFPSIRVIFPTIDRVKSSRCGILPSKHTILFRGIKHGKRLKSVDILHDAIPHPSDRVGHPMHVKVARGCFKSNTGASSGWVYCESHNLSAAAWGRPKGSSSVMRLHVCNYELSCIFVFPASWTKDNSRENPTNLDDIRLHFVVPAPKYGPRDKPATMQGRVLDDITPIDEMMEAEDEEDDEVEVTDYVAPEAEEEKAYADVLWHHVDSSQSF
ncbi:hypothetical protein RND81_04G124700, partial [Saponaria officinalis]